MPVLIGYITAVLPQDLSGEFEILWSEDYLLRKGRECSGTVPWYTSGFT